MDKKPLFIAGPCVIESAELLDTVAATLASTGTPSFFLQPGEAYQDDLGINSTEENVLALY